MILITVCISKIHVIVGTAFQVNCFIDMSELSETLEVMWSNHTFYRREKEG